MSATDSERPDSATSSGDTSGDPGEERRVLSYEGSKVPLFLILLWLAFFVWGVIYMIRWIPESWQEWIRS